MAKVNLTRRTGGLLALLVVLMMAACSPAPPPPTPTLTPEYGTVTGTLELAAILTRPIKGTLYLHGSRNVSLRAVASSDGSFALRVPVGSYGISGRSPLYQSGSQDCWAGPVTVGVRQTVRVTVICEGC